MFEERSYDECLTCFIELRRDLLDVYSALVHSSAYPVELIAAVERRIDLLDAIIPRLMSLQQLGPLADWVEPAQVVGDEGKVTT